MMKYCSYCGSPIDSIFDDKCEHCGEDLVIENTPSSNTNKSNVINNEESSTSKRDVFSRYSKYKEVYDENNNLLYKEVTSFDDIENTSFRSLFKKTKTSKQRYDKKSDKHQDVNSYNATSSNNSYSTSYINNSSNTNTNTTNINYNSHISDKSSNKNKYKPIYNESSTYPNDLPYTLRLFFNNLNETNKSSTWIKNKYIAAFLAIVFGTFGAHKFYLGKYKIGIIYLILSFTGAIELIELISSIEGLIYLFTPKDKFIKYL